MMKRHIVIVITLALLSCSQVLWAQVSPEERQAAKAEKISEMKKAEQSPTDSQAGQKAEKVKILDASKTSTKEEKPTLTESPSSTSNTEKRSAVKKDAKATQNVRQEAVTATKVEASGLQEKQAFIDAEKQAYEQANPEEKQAILMQKLESENLTDEQKLAIKMEFAGLEGGKQTSIFPTSKPSLAEKIEMKINHQIEKTENLSSQDVEKLRKELREQYTKENR
jgi:hypothetical protein